jgi:copper chaperone CopZ
METVAMNTPSASCGGCKANIAEAFENVDGVESAVLDLDTKHTTVTYDPAVIDVDAITETLTEAGYAPSA